MENYNIEKSFLEPISRTTSNIIIVDRKGFVQQDLDGSLHEHPARFTNTKHGLKNLDDGTIVFYIGGQ